MDEVTENTTPSESYWLCPLYFFNCYSGDISLSESIEGVELAEEIKIKPATSELKEHLLRFYPDWEYADTFSYMAVLPQSEECNLSVEIAIEEATYKQNLLNDLVTALRLYRTGILTPGPLMSAQPTPSPFNILGFRYDFDSFGWQNIPSGFGDLTFVFNTEADIDSFSLPGYQFRHSDTPEINKLMLVIRSLRASGKLGSLDDALRRFNSAYYGKFEDRLIDQMIAFESLFIRDDKELGYKLALRTAFLLGKRRKQIFSDIREAYNLRGQIVHSNKKIDVKKLLVTIPKTEEYLRQSIRRFLLLLSQGMSFEEIRGKLDENIIKTGRVLALK